MAPLELEITLTLSPSRNIWPCSGTTTTIKVDPSSFCTAIFNPSPRVSCLSTPLPVKLPATDPTIEVAIRPQPLPIALPNKPPAIEPLVDPIQEELPSTLTTSAVFTVPTIVV